MTPLDLISHQSASASIINMYTKQNTPIFRMAWWCNAYPGKNQLPRLWMCWQACHSRRQTPTDNLIIDNLSKSTQSSSNLAIYFWRKQKCVSKQERQKYMNNPWLHIGCCMIIKSGIKAKKTIRHPILTVISCFTRLHLSTLSLISIDKVVRCCSCILHTHIGQKTPTGDLILDIL